MKQAAYESLKADDVSRTAPRMALAGQHFMECDGLEVLYRMIGHHDGQDQHEIADDARKPKRSLHRSAFPLASFLSLHIAEQANRLGSAVGRRMMFGKKPSSQPAPERSKSATSYSRGEGRKATKRIRSSWHVSPLLFRVITAFTRVHVKRFTPEQQQQQQQQQQHRQSGGRLLGTGRNETKVYTFDDLAQEHPRMHGVCLHMYTSAKPREPFCFAGRDASHVVRLVNASSDATPFLSGIALKDILDDEDAGTELQYHQRIHRWFSEAHSLHLTCLHPHLHFVEVDETKATLQGSPPAEPSGRKLLVTRLLYGDAHHLPLREDELVDLSIAVLQGLQVLHDHHHLHMDIKPENILWEVDHRTSRRTFCLSDYNLMMSDSHVLHFLRPDDGGGFQSLTHGTEGYKSPLLMQDDLKGNTYGIFAYVATKSRAFSKNAMPVWREYFDRSRLSTTMAKVDLHSLALTLLRLAKPHGQDKRITLKMLRGPFGKFVARLMFFRPHDFSTATEALTYLRSSSRDRSRSRGA